MKWPTATLREDNWLTRAICAAAGAVFVGPPLAEFFGTGRWPYLLIASGYGLFTLAMWLSIHMNAPSRHEQFGPRVRMAAKRAPFLGVAVAAVGVFIRWHGV